MSHMTPLYLDELKRVQTRQKPSKPFTHLRERTKQTEGQRNKMNKRKEKEKVSPDPTHAEGGTKSPERGRGPRTADSDVYTVLFKCLDKCQLLKNVHSSQETFG